MWAVTSSLARWPGSRTKHKWEIGINLLGKVYLDSSFRIGNSVKISVYRVNSYLSMTLARENFSECLRRLILNKSNHALATAE